MADGEYEGRTDGGDDGSFVGEALGLCEGSVLGLEDGPMVGTDDGVDEGADVGTDDGAADGTEEGRVDGKELGRMLGINEGRAVGSVLGPEEGNFVGFEVGILVGSLVSSVNLSIAQPDTETRVMFDKQLHKTVLSVALRDVLIRAIRPIRKELKTIKPDSAVGSEEGTVVGAGDGRSGLRVRLMTGDEVYRVLYSVGSKVGVEG